MSSPPTAHCSALLLRYTLPPSFPPGALSSPPIFFLPMIIGQLKAVFLDPLIYNTSFLLILVCTSPHPVSGVPTYSVQLSPRTSSRGSSSTIIWYYLRNMNNVLCPEEMAGPCGKKALVCGMLDVACGWLFPHVMTWAGSRWFME